MLAKQQSAENVHPLGHQRPVGLGSVVRASTVNRSMQYLELQLVCTQHPEGERPILGAWWIASHFDDFGPAQVNERANAAVERQLFTEPDGTT